MRTIVLDASKWRSWADFYDALLAAIEAPDWHGRSVDALIDSMIWGGINKLEPPYIVKIVATSNLPKDVLDETRLVAMHLEKASQEFRARKGRDAGVSMEICP